MSGTRYSANELLSLVSRIFHDVNNRLLVIQFACAKLLRGLSCDDMNYVTVLAIDEARQQAADLTLQFGDLKRAELRKDSGTNLNDLVRRWEPLITGVARENVIIEIDLSSKPAIVMACHESVERILPLSLMVDGSPSTQVTLEVSKLQLRICRFPSLLVRYGSVFQIQVVKRLN